MLDVTVSTLSAVAFIDDGDDDRDEHGSIGLGLGGAFGMAAMFHEPGGHMQAQLHVSA